MIICFVCGIQLQAQGLTDAFEDATISNANFTHLNYDGSDYSAVSSIENGELKFEFTHKSGTSPTFQVFAYTFPSALDLSGTGNTITFRIKSSKQYPLYLQFMKDNGSGGYDQVEAVFRNSLVYAADGAWQTVTAPIGNIVNYDAITRVRIGINTAGTGTDYLAESGVVYLDNFVVGDGSTVIGPMPAAALVNSGLSDDFNNAVVSNTLLGHAESNMLTSSTFDDEGNGVLKFDYTSGTGETFKRARYYAPANATGGYFNLSAGATISMKVKSSLAYPVILQAVDKDGKLSTSNATTTYDVSGGNADTWQTLTATITFPDGTSDTEIAYIRIYVNGNNNVPTTGTLYIDDIVIGDGSYTVGNVLSVKEEFQIEASLYPNPSKGIIYVNSKETVKNFRVFNVLGQEIISKTLNASNKNFEINLSSFSKGIYTIQLQGEKGRLSKKIILE
tara:strand:+ start:85541 stop:86884 length:1344 start_codon:yes stop_codon:yes gene_type:complete